MTTYTHQTAPTQFVQANGMRFAYRRFGNHRGAADRESGAAQHGGSLCRPFAVAACSSSQDFGRA